MFLLPKPVDGSVPETAEVVSLTHEQSFKEAAGMDPGFGAILDQDTDNLTMQQEGLEASAKHGLTLGNYQEIRVRHFNKCSRQIHGDGAESARLDKTPAALIGQSDNKIRATFGWPKPWERTQ